jgi:hypothetical protein
MTTGATSRQVNEAEDMTVRGSTSGSEG